MAKPSIEDRLAIEDLFVRYTTALDEGDVEDVVAASPTMVGSTVPSSAVTKARRSCVNSPSRLLSAGDAEPNSVMSSATFASTSQATKAMRAAISSTSPLSPGVTTLLSPGEYDCELTRTGGEWLFASRLVVMDKPFSIP